jgi:hypothetical protein
MPGVGPMCNRGSAQVPGRRSGPVGSPLAVPTADAVLVQNDAGGRQNTVMLWHIGLMVTVRVGL